MRLSLRTLWGAFLRWRTVVLLEQIDADARALEQLRDIDIPIALRSLDHEKRELTKQLVALMPDAERTSYPKAIEPKPLPEGWPPTRACPPGPRFNQPKRNRQ